ncbi:hypothetical protein NE237_016754 [Protea cynaroides]|uniref:Uncharacterized protein n=1 Tax=Protea cynaroides TaxID=273540 RepID=A0A9Q0HFJ4_9MAGN|nr:hypothetical protein NE237_016754 [Protea cynaroides]
MKTIEFPDCHQLYQNDFMAHRTEPHLCLTGLTARPFPASIYKHRKPSLEAFITIKTSNCTLTELLDLDSLLENGSDDDDDDLHGMLHCTLDEILSESDSSSSPSSPSSFNSDVFLSNSHSLFNKDGQKRTWLLG